ncbi:GntR family transcriptional regulator [Wenxinia marina]|uniref:Transcriptional regulator, GntR family n=1 Tax=Wenxinia marina DSM 24838 TaxID=1123501 RepID=A0A0D0P7C8_9RHOB|nr:GntR family transcriptional regulator [Wenxinia marina]KIQ67496.1 transcriptional regulator, GntR family [Wenxinia marina DSM 24838]GGL69068.1 GntR family transcriptional regulator [Wenxinia marina]
MLVHRFDVAGREGETVGDVAHRRIRSDIVHARLKPMQKLKLEVLKERYGVSVSTLREILSKLTVEELVVAEGQRGFQVAPVTQGGLRDISELRILLETFALRKSLAAGDLDWQGNVVSAHYKLATVEKKLMNGDPEQVEQWVRHDWGFHYATISACDAPALMQAHSSIFDRHQRYHMLVPHFRGKLAADEHERLRDLVLDRKADEAVDLLTSHVRAGVEHVLSVGTIPA